MYSGSRFYNDPYFADPFMASDPHIGAPDPRRRSHPAPSNVIIEEIHDEDENEEEEEEREHAYRTNQRRRPSQPIVEEPGEQEFRGRAPHPVHDRRQAYNQVSPFMNDPFFGAMSMFPLMPFSSMFGMRSLNDMSTLMSSGSNFCSYSSSVTTMGPDGHVYSSTSSSKRGPGGVVESHQTERDTRSGVDKMTIHRQLGEKSRTLTRTRDRSGREERLEDLHGIEQEHATTFDHEWTRAASGTGITGSRSQQVPAAIEYQPQHTRQPMRQEPTYHNHHPTTLNHHHSTSQNHHHLNHHPSTSSHHHVDHPRYTHHPTAYHTHHHTPPGHSTTHAAAHSAHMAAHNQAHQAHNQYYDTSAYRQDRGSKKRDRNM